MHLYVYIDLTADLPEMEEGKKERGRYYVYIHVMCKIHLISDAHGIVCTDVSSHSKILNHEDLLALGAFCLRQGSKFDSSLVSKLILVKIFRTDGNFQSFFVIPSPPKKNKNKHRRHRAEIRAVSLRHSEKRAKLSPEEAMGCDKIWRSPQP